MLTFSHFKRFCLAGTVAVAVLCAPATLAPITAAGAAEMTETLAYGAWHGTFMANGGYMISSKVGDGGIVSLFFNGQSISLIMAGPRWKMTVGEKLPVRMTIDHVTLSHEPAVMSEEAVVLNAGAIAIKDVSNAVLVKLALAKKVTFNIGSNGLVWDVDLDGFSATLAATAHAHARPA